MITGNKLIGIVGVCMCAGAAVFFSGCSSESPEEHCKMASDHMTEIILKSEMFQSMSKAAQEDWKSDSLSNASKSHVIEKCVKDYDKDTVDCALKTSNLEEMKKCSQLIGK